MADHLQAAGAGSTELRHERTASVTEHDEIIEPAVAGHIDRGGDTARRRNHDNPAIDRVENDEVPGRGIDLHRVGNGDLTVEFGDAETDLVGAGPEPECDGNNGFDRNRLGFDHAGVECDGHRSRDRRRNRAVDRGRCGERDRRPAQRCGHLDDRDPPLRRCVERRRRRGGHRRDRNTDRFGLRTAHHRQLGGERAVGHDEHRRPHERQLDRIRCCVERFRCSCRRGLRGRLRHHGRRWSRRRVRRVGIVGTVRTRSDGDRERDDKPQRSKSRRRTGGGPTVRSRRPHGFHATRSDLHRAEAMVTHKRAPPALHRRASARLCRWPTNC